MNRNLCPIFPVFMKIHDLLELSYYINFQPLYALKLLDGENIPEGCINKKYNKMKFTVPCHISSDILFKLFAGNGTGININNVNSIPHIIFSNDSIMIDNKIYPLNNMVLSFTVDKWYYNESLYDRYIHHFTIVSQNNIFYLINTFGGKYSYNLEILSSEEVFELIKVLLNRNADSFISLNNIWDKYFNNEYVIINNCIIKKKLDTQFQEGINFPTTYINIAPFYSELNCFDTIKKNVEDNLHLISNIVNVALQVKDGITEQQLLDKMSLIKNEGLYNKDKYNTILETFKNQTIIKFRENNPKLKVMKKYSKKIAYQIIWYATHIRYNFTEDMLIDPDIFKANILLNPPPFKEL